MFFNTINTILFYKLQRFYIASSSLLEHYKTFRFELSFFLKMDLNVYIHLIFLRVVIVIYIFFGIALNTLVIASN